MKIGVVGATGLVGNTLVNQIIEHITDAYHLYLFGRKDSKLCINKTCFPVYSINLLLQFPLDVVLFATPTEVSRKWIPLLLSKTHAVVIDGSSAFRQANDIPLFIPEIHSEDKISNAQCISSPNCTTTLAMMALYPLHKSYGLQSLSLCSYQAASGLGRKGYTELVNQCRNWAFNKNTKASSLFYRPLLFNAIPQIGTFDISGTSEEEQKILSESRKILDLPNLNVFSTCVRIPVLTCHSIAISATFNKSISIEQAKEAFINAPGIKFYDNDYPDVYCAMHDSLCHVGRLRWDTTRNNTLALWVVGNQLLKGSATNMRQILEIKLRQILNKPRLKTHT